MFRILSCFLILGLVLAAASCGQSDNPAEETAQFTFDISQSFTFAENPAANDEIGTLVVSATLNGEPVQVSFAILSQTPEGAMAIGETTGTLTVADPAAFDFEVNQTITATIEIRAGDAVETVQVTITLTDIDETQPIVIAVEPQVFTIDENPENGTEVGTLAASASQGGEQLSVGFSLVSQTPEAAFALSQAGVLTVADGTLADFEVNPVFTLEVNAQSGDSTEAFTVTVNLNDVQEANPVFSGEGFLMTWQVPANRLSIRIPVDLSSRDERDLNLEFNYTVDWGDGTQDAGQTGDAFHTYAEAGTYQIRIDGVFPRIHFEGEPVMASLVQSIDAWGTHKWASFYQSFYQCSALQVTATDAPDLSNCERLFGMFERCSQLAEPDFSNWNTSTIKDFGYMFSGAPSFNGNVTTWNTSSATSLSYMFDGCRNFNQDISNWDVSNVERMMATFRSAESFNQPIGSWNTASLQVADILFSGASAFNQPLNNWDMSSVTTMEYMFNAATSFNQDLDQWNVSNVTNMFNAFAAADAFNGNIGTWDVSRVENMGGMFRFCDSFNQDLNNWQTGAVTNMSSMFFQTTLFNGDITTWNTANVDRMTGMFEAALAFNRDISGWDVSRVTSMPRMFERNPVFDQPIGSWNVSQVTNMDDMFLAATSFNRDLNLWDVSNVTTMKGIFQDAASFNGNISDWDISGLRSLEDVFHGATSFNQPIGSWNTTGVTNMVRTFLEASSFNQDISGWDLSAVTTMASMFARASSFDQPLNSWDVSSVTRMEYLFSDATSFNQALDQWDVSKVTVMSWMFDGATLFDQDISGWAFNDGVFLSNTFNDCGLSVANYDLLLAAWDASTLPAKPVGARGLEYCNTTARTSLSGKGWNISNDSQSASCP